MPAFRPRLVFVFLLALCVTLASACGGDDEGATPAPAPAEPAQTALPGADLQPVKSYLLRHTAYHVLDHTWEMQDRDLTNHATTG